MSQSLNDAADGFEAICNAVAPTEIAFYSEPTELLSPPIVAGIAGEVYFSGMKSVNAADLLFDVMADLELSTSADVTGWAEAVRRIRTLTSPYGSGSIAVAIRANPTLGGKVSSCLPADGGLMAEVLKGYQDGNRWTARLRYKVRLAA